MREEISAPNPRIPSRRIELCSYRGCGSRNDCCIQCRHEQRELDQEGLDHRRKTRGGLDSSERTKSATTIALRRHVLLFEF